MRPFRLAFAGTLCAVLLAGSCSVPISAEAASAPATVPRVRDGSHDFDFLYGSWVMHNRRLKAPVVSSHDWAQFDSTDVARPLPGGLGNDDFYRSNYPRKGFVGVTIRLYERATGLWRIYWIDNSKSHGDAGAPNVGRWRGNVGIFDERLLIQGKPVVDRYTWTRFGEHAKVAAHFAESISLDDGKTWKVVFTNDLIRSAPMAASSGSAPEESAQPAPTTVRDGSHDFDFEYGKWRMPNQRLVQRLAGSPPVVGRFDGNVGIFKGNDAFNGKPIVVRFIWTVDPKGSRVVAKWQQAFSTDGGKTWEVNWRNELIHDDDCKSAQPRA